MQYVALIQQGMVTYQKVIAVGDDPAVLQALADEAAVATQPQGMALEYSAVVLPVPDKVAPAGA